MNKYTDDDLKDIIKLYQPYSKETLTMEDAREIIDNLKDLMHCMDEVENEVLSRDTEFILPPLEWFEDPKNYNKIPVIDIHTKKPCIPDIVRRCSGMPIYLNTRDSNKSVNAQVKK